MKTPAEVDVLEGQTFAGKTTVGIPKFLFYVAQSDKRQHGIAGLDIGTIEKNIINKDMGIIDLFGDCIKYNGNGTGDEKLPHLLMPTSKGNKIIYVFGYNDVAKWKKALGGQMGGLFIDEGNISNIDFIREAFMRADYKLITLNPDDPNLPIYDEYINHCRPIEKYKNDTPQEMMCQLESRPAKEGWHHWYFTMDDNAAATEEKKTMIRNSVPVGTKLYKNKILGLRGRAEGLVFDKFDRHRQAIPIQSFKFLPNESVYRVIVGLDSGLNADATAAIPIMLTTAGRLICLPSFYYVPKNGTNASSQQAKLLESWLDYWFNRFKIMVEGIATIICDSAALTQALLLEIRLYTHYDGMPVLKKDIMQDTQRAIGTIEKDNFFIINAGDIDPVTMQKRGEVDMFIVELENKVWDKKKGNVPEDGNDHCIDAFKYGTYYIYYGGI